MKAARTGEVLVLGLAQRDRSYWSVKTVDFANMTKTTRAVNLGVYLCAAES